MELAIDLAPLALYDIVIYADDSGSMAFEEGGDRINDLKLIVGRVAEVTFPSCCSLVLDALRFDGSAQYRYALPVLVDTCVHRDP